MTSLVTLKVKSLIKRLFGVVCGVTDPATYKLSCFVTGACIQRIRTFHSPIICLFSCACVLYMTGIGVKKTCVLSKPKSFLFHFFVRCLSFFHLSPSVKKENKRKRGIYFTNLR